MKYIIRDREAGNEIETFNTKEEAVRRLDEFEADDRDEGTFTPDFYEIVEEGPIEEKILRNDTTSKYCELDIQQHLKMGVFYYENYEEYHEKLSDIGIEEEDILSGWEKLDRSTVDGIEYRYEVVL